MEINWLENVQYQDLKREINSDFPQWEVALSIGNKFLVNDENGNELIFATESQIMWWLTGIRFALEKLKTG